MSSPCHSPIQYGPCCATAAVAASSAVTSCMLVSFAGRVPVAPTAASVSWSGSAFAQSLNASRTEMMVVSGTVERCVPALLDAPADGPMSIVYRPSAPTEIWSFSTVAVGEPVVPEPGKPVMAWKLRSSEFPRFPRSVYCRVPSTIAM